MDNSERVSAMKQKLEVHLSPSELIIEDVNIQILESIQKDISIFHL